MWITKIKRKKIPQICKFQNYRAVSPFRACNFPRMKSFPDRSARSLIGVQFRNPKIWATARRLIDNPHLCRPHGTSTVQGPGFSVHVRGAVSINICFYEWKVGRLEKLLPMWTLACLGGSVPRLATRLRAGTHAGSTATHDPQPIRSFVSLKRVPRPRARSSIRTRRVRFFVSFARGSFLFFFLSPRLDSRSLGSIVSSKYSSYCERISKLDRCWENERGSENDED